MIRTIQEFHQHFKTDEQCLEYLYASLYRDPECPKCGRVGAYHRNGAKPCYTCNCGRSQLFPMKHTIFRDSPIPLTKWFYAVFLMSQSEEGVSAKELERRLGVTYTTAWKMAKRIRSVRPDASQWGKPIFFELFLQSCILETPAESAAAPASVKKAVKTAR